jgi:hypothetical protein
MVTPELSDHPATWISDNKATGVSSITLQLRGSISDTYIDLLRPSLRFVTLCSSCATQNAANARTLVVNVCYDIAGWNRNHAWGIGIGPPGEFSFAAVKTSTPVSVTSMVCSTRR